MTLKPPIIIETNTVEEIQAEIDNLETLRKDYAQNGYYRDAREIEYMIADLRLRIQRRKEQDAKNG